MELFKLQGVIDVDNTKANKQLDETSEKGGKAQSKLSSAFSKIGKGAAVVGKAVAGGMVAAGTAIAGLVTQSTSAYAEYEQLVGGVDTLFKNSSKKVQAYAAEAYKTVGLSANDYMSTVTSFSATLLQSLDGDTSKAADVANRAIQDMSDNANKMGTDMSMIQNAYQGFAKQNYTMLDNLKLGYGGSAGEMARLINESGVLGDAIEVTAETVKDVPFDKIIEAIGTVQDRMGITGTTAKEAAGTISGSMASVKASWANLVTAMASDNLPLDEYISNFVNSATGVVSNMLPRIQKALDGAVQLIQKLAPVVIGAIPDLLSQLLPSVITAATDLINAIIEILPSLIDMLVNDLLPQLLDGFTKIIVALVEALPQFIEAIVSALPTLLPQLIDALVTVVVTLCTNFSSIIQPIIDYLPEIIVAVVNALIANLPALIEGCIALIAGICQALPQIWNALTEAIEMLLRSWVDKIGEWLAPVIEAFKSIWESLTGIVSGVWEKIKSVISIAIQLIGSILKAAFDIITLPFRFIWENCKDTIMSVWNTIKEKVSSAINAVKDVISSVMNAIKGFILPIWESIKNAISNAVNAVKSTVSNVFNSVKSTVSNIWNSIKSTISNVSNSIRSTVSNIFNKVKDAMSKPIEKARDLIKGIVDKIKGFFSGMKLSFPKVKLPHFSIKPKGWKIGDLLEGSIPSLGIEWYKKGAIFTEGIMTKPTAFGVSGKGALRVGGEAGAEAVAPISKLQEYVAAAATSGNAELAEKLDTLISLLTLYLPLLLEKELRLDTGALVGELVSPLDVALGDLTRRKARGRT